MLVIIKLSPFESNRITAVAIWMLSISKIVTTGLSIAFLPDFGASRIAATVLGIVIIIVQGFVAIAVLVLILTGIISAWTSLSRNREEFPEPLNQVRIRYFEHIDACATDLPPKPKEADKSPEAPVEPYFNVKDVCRAPKIGDQSVAAASGAPDPPGHVVALSASASVRRSRANSASSHCSVNNIPCTGRTHRASWTAKDVALWDAEMNRGDIQRAGLPRSRSGSLRMHGVNDGLETGTPGRRPPMTPMLESFEGPMWSPTAPTAPASSPGEEPDSSMGRLAEKDEADESSAERLAGSHPQLPTAEKQHPASHTLEDVKTQETAAPSAPSEPAAEGIEEGVEVQSPPTVAKPDEEKA